MRRQNEKIDSFQIAHRDFVKNLSQCLDMLERDFEESREIDTICNGEWCRAIEMNFDELAKDLYSISEPRWVSDDFSRTLRNMRRRLHDVYVYAKYHGAGSTVH